MSEADLLPAPKLSAQEKALASARDKLSRYVERAVEILTELAETSENDRVRLSAADSILDRAGMSKAATTQVSVNVGEHEAARKDAEDVLARINANQAEQARKSAAIEAHEVSLEALIVLEGVLDEGAS
jgi:hypothetical protein